jgi:ribosome-binding protein aMBF1 (putative translation factor)
MPPRVKEAAFHRAVGTAIKTFRQAVGMEQKTLAERAEIHPAVLDAIEKGEYTKLSLWKVEKLAAPLGVRVSQIVSLAEANADKQSRRRRRK